MFIKKICLPGILFFSIVTAYGQQIIESEPLGSFSRLTLTGPLRVELIPAEESQMQIILWDITPKQIAWEIKDNTLTVSTRKALINKRAFAEIKLFYKQIDQINCSGAEVTSKDTLTAIDLTLKAESSANKITLNVSTDNLNIIASGNSIVTVGGTAQHASYSARFGGKIAGFRLSADRITADANTRGEIQLRCNEQLDAEAYTGGNIFFLGEPATLNIKKSTAGGVESVNQ